MSIVVTGNSISGVVPATPSKSVMQRYIAAALLAEGESIIKRPSFSDDTEASLRMASALGARVTRDEESIRITGGISNGDSILNGGESGLGIRLFASLAALSSGNILITGSGSSLRRPMRHIAGPLRSLGASVKHNKGYLPLEIRGPVRGGKVTVDGSLSSQFLTGILMALPTCEDDSEIRVKNLNSKPYIDLTIETMASCGVRLSNNNYKSFNIEGNQVYKPFEINVEGDWSGAATILVMGAISGESAVSGLNASSRQADVAVVEALKMAGARVAISDNLIKCSHDTLQGFNFNITDCPDLAPALTVLALAASGESRLRGAGRLKAKESNRAEALVTMFTAMGGKIKLTGDELIIKGGKRLSGGVTDSFNDHRMAMAAAVSSLLSDSPVEILRPECISKSYPEFYHHFEALGGKIKTI